MARASTIEPRTPTATSSTFLLPGAPPPRASSPRLHGRPEKPHGKRMPEQAHQNSRPDPHLPSSPRPARDAGTHHPPTHLLTSPALPQEEAAAPRRQGRRNGAPKQAVEDAASSAASRGRSLDGAEKPRVPKDAGPTASPQRMPTQRTRASITTLHSGSTSTSKTRPAGHLTTLSTKHDRDPGFPHPPAAEAAGGGRGNPRLAGKNGGENGIRLSQPFTSEGNERVGRALSFYIGLVICTVKDPFL